jgi:predicted DNA-binding protein
MLALRLPDEIEKRLEKLAQRTAHTKTYLGAAGNSAAH